MPRSRNIKHGFFTNDDLADVPPLGRLLFIGLWTIADFNGNLEWKPKKIKAQVLPYDDCDIDALGINLDKSGFISIYSSNGDHYANITNFEKHQRPHINEKRKGTDIPEFTEKDAQAVDSKVVGTNTDSIGANAPDSLFLIPVSRSLLPVPFYLIADPCKKETSKQGPDKSGVSTKRFIQPTLQEVTDYCKERNNTVNPQGFIDHYEASGWMRGKSKIKSWKACVRTWEGNDRSNGKGQPETLDAFVDRATSAGERLKENLERREHGQ